MFTTWANGGYREYMVIRYVASVYNLGLMITAKVGSRICEIPLSTKIAQLGLLPTLMGANIN